MILLGESVETWFEKLRGAELELREILNANFDDAVQKEDFASIERFFKLFPLLNRQEEGLEKFTKHLCTKVSVIEILYFIVYRVSSFHKVTTILLKTFIKNF